MVEHLGRVASRVEGFARGDAMASELLLAAKLHDLGKYGELFQRRLQNREHRIDHWSAGAWIAASRYKAFAAAVAIQGHHVGLQRLNKDALRSLNPQELSEAHPLGLRLSDPDVERLIHRMSEETSLPEPLANSIYGRSLQETAGAMLDVRMLFSALVDADYLATETHFAEGLPEAKKPRRQAPTLQADKALQTLLAHLRQLSQASDAGTNVRALRQDLLTACLDAGRLPQGLFTLSAPTGSGKTLAMLAFALRHAMEHRLNRIIIVIPYLSIIEQTARVYRDILEPVFGEHYVLEHHSLAGTRREPTADADADQDNESDSLRTARLLSENWDAPLVVTTTVQCLESLFASRPSACRKLHRLARSVLLFDEVQTLPPDKAVPTLATLARLSERFGSTVVFSTATQPAFGHLEREIRAMGAVGWSPAEIAPPTLRLFDGARRTRVQWPEAEERLSWEELAGILAQPSHRQVLCVVNLKRHALELIKALKALKAEGLYHLSTSMCPLHRQRTLDSIRLLLSQKQPCRLISTQCVEAGVDVDFPLAYRAWGPLEAIAQVCGRCNRNGRNETLGSVRVFLPQDETRLYPPGVYEQAAGVAMALLKSRGPKGMDLDDPTIFGDYYRFFYGLTNVGAMEEGKPRELKEAIRRQDFEEVARLYRMIEQDNINVLVPYDLEAYEALAREARHDGLNGRWIAKARPHTVSLFRPKPDASVTPYLNPVPLTRRDHSDEWFIYLDAEHYDDTFGLLPPGGFPGPM